MLAFKQDGVWIEWERQLLTRVGGTEFIQLPRNVEDVWPDNDLADFGLRRVIMAVTPPGYRMVSYTLDDAAGLPQQIGVYEPLPPPGPPERVTRAQAETALYRNGLYEQYEALIANHPYPPVRIWAKGASVWYRSHPFVAAMAAEMVPPLDDDKIDNLFIEASSYEA